MEIGERERRRWGGGYRERLGEMGIVGEWVEVRDRSRGDGRDARGEIRCGKQ